MLAPMLQLFLALIFVALVCVITYKITLPLIIKIVNLSIESTRFRMGLSFLLAAMFFAIGALQLSDFIEESNPGLSRFFPLSFLITGIWLFLGLRKHPLAK
jgi:hypothetical protein